MMTVHPSDLSCLRPPARLRLVPLAQAGQIAAEGELSHCTRRDLSTALLWSERTPQVQKLQVVCYAVQSKTVKPRDWHQRAVFPHEVMGLFPFPSPSIFIVVSGPWRPEGKKCENIKASFACCGYTSLELVPNTELSFLQIRAGPRVNALPPLHACFCLPGATYVCVGVQEENAPTVLPSHKPCLVSWVEKPHHSLVRSLFWETRPDTTVTPDTSPVLPICPVDVLAVWPGSGHHYEPSLLQIRAFQALSLLWPLERPVLLSQVHVTEGSKSTYYCRNKQKFSWACFFLSKM